MHKEDGSADRRSVVDAVRLGWLEMTGHGKPGDLRSRTVLADPRMDSPQSNGHEQRRLFQISAQRRAQVVGSLLLLGGGTPLGVENVIAKMSVDYFGHQRVHGAAAGGNVVQHHRTFRFFVQRSLDRFHLPADPPRAVQESFLLVGRVGHKKSAIRRKFAIDAYTPVGIA
jgi:hypothetical protein